MPHTCWWCGWAAVGCDRIQLCCACVCMWTLPYTYCIDPAPTYSSCTHTYSIGSHVVFPYMSGTIREEIKQLLKHMTLFKSIWWYMCATGWPLLFKKKMSPFFKILDTHSTGKGACCSKHCNILWSPSSRFCVSLLYKNQPANRWMELPANSEEERQEPRGKLRLHPPQTASVQGVLESIPASTGQEAGIHPG